MDPGLNFLFQAHAGPRLLGGPAEAERGHAGGGEGQKRPAHAQERVGRADGPGLEPRSTTFRISPRPQPPAPYPLIKSTSNVSS